MNKKMGRPTDNPRNKRMEIRTNQEELEKLEYCSKELGVSRTQVISKGIEKVYKELVEKNK